MNNSELIYWKKKKSYYYLKINKIKLGRYIIILEKTAMVNTQNRM